MNTYYTEHLTDSLFKEGCKMKKRIEELDIVKGFAILFVLLVHIVRFDGIAHYFFNAFGEGTIFVFFVISGYSYRSGKGKPLNILLTRFKQLLVPYFLYALVLGILQMMIERVSLTDFGYGFLCFLLTKPTMEFFALGEYAPSVFSIIVSPYWFLRMMLMSSTIFFLVVDWTIGNFRRFIAVEAALFGVSAVLLETIRVLPFHLQIAPVFAAAMLLGAFLGKTGILSQNLWDRKYFPTVFTVSMIVMFVIAAFYTEGGMAGSTGNFGSKGALSELWYIIISLANTVFILGISAAFVRLGRYKAMTYIGRNSLYFFMLHLFFAHNIHLFSGLYCKIDDWAGEQVRPGVMGESLVVLILTILLVLAYIRIRNSVVRLKRK